jgi:hypothetical protein
MRHRRFTLMLVGLACFVALALQADPENLLVGNLTFNRPSAWTLGEPPKESSALSRLIIRAEGSSVKSDVRFYVVNKPVTTEPDTILTQFPNCSKQDLQQETFMIGKQKVIYFRIEGTYQFKTSPPRIGQTWFSAAIPQGSKKFIYVRMLGPKADVEENLVAFKQMIEAGVKQRYLN